MSLATCMQIKFLENLIIMESRTVDLLVVIRASATRRSCGLSLHAASCGTEATAPVRRALRRATRAMATEEEEDAEEGALHDNLFTATRSRSSRASTHLFPAVRTERTGEVTELLILNSYHRSLRHLLSTPTSAELLSYDSFAWTGPSNRFIPGRREARTRRFQRFVR
ncbi:hypothetical protein B0H13DRAFT_1867944 [Mycena leptocephala]|nr:hypothetical protein B0H13DRAFT_1867944 [Mycena leptocephala]